MFKKENKFYDIQKKILKAELIKINSLLNKKMLIK